MVKFWTDKGIAKLGEIVRKSRLELGWSFRRLEQEIKQANPGRRKGLATHKTIKNLESGIGNPRWDTLAAIISVGFVLHPRLGRPLTEYELLDIAAEWLNPDTGWYSLSPQEIPTISKLIQIEIKNRSEWRGLEELGLDTQLSVSRLIQLIDGAAPSNSELCKLAQGLRKSSEEYWSETELIELVASSFPPGVGEIGE